MATYWLKWMSLDKRPSKHYCTRTLRSLCRYMCVSVCVCVCVCVSVCVCVCASKGPHTYRTACLYMYIPFGGYPVVCPVVRLATGTRGLRRDSPSVTRSTAVGSWLKREKTVRRHIRVRSVCVYVYMCVCVCVFEIASKETHTHPQHVVHSRIQFVTRWHVHPLPSCGSRSRSRKLQSADTLFIAVCE